jgi:hypothetical protein
MEMNFPHLETKSGLPAKGRDYRALLSSAISRQGNSHTARIMLVSSRRKNDDPLTKDGIISERIRYFAARSGRFVKECAPHGAFFPLIDGKKTQNSICEDAVYQDALMNGKDNMLQTSLSETQTAMSGQKIRGLYD